MAARKFATLDALRGVAALAVVLFHLSGPLAPEGYLAVDLFFLMSGFVVAAAYEERLLQGWSSGAFLLVRLKRLWPVYAAGVVLGLLCIAAIRWLQPGAGFSFPPASLAQVFAMSLLLLPQLVAYDGPAFPFNSASWSLSVELFGNLAYAALARSLRTPILIVFAAAGLAGLVLVAWRTGSLDAGVAYGDLAGGYVRFLFSFSVGVLLHRLHAVGRLPVLTLHWCIPLLGAAASFTALGGVGGMRDIVVVSLVYPAVLVAALHNPVSPRLTRAFAWTGAVSYPLYILHPPVVQAVQVLAAGRYYAAASVVLAVAVVALAALTNRYFDQPVQNFFRRRRLALPV
ncbi:MAG TPA: acyltransferase [Rhizomicrobium sp.]